ncbi:MAG TPA: transglycosylase SLT domain-containing protein [Stellaceae bacterium]|nr:transglycosylase SLT domain-containing protein [Stellaceae bacterium]
MAVPNNPYPALQRAVDPALVRNIRQASQSSSTDFGLLMAQAAQESGFKPDAKSAGGSAAGLFQFIDSTWLDMVHRFGAKYGAGDLASQISVSAAGKPEVADPATRQRILALRSDPALSASLAGEYAKLNKDEVERALGHGVGAADVYMAHFLGAGGATQFLRALESDGATPAADLLPDAAANNRGVFYDGATGRAKSVAEIYRTLGGRIEQQANDFAGLAGDGDAVQGDMNETLPASGGAAPSVSRRFDFAGLHLSQPVAAMLDTLTLVALRIVNGGGAQAAHPRRSDTPAGT